MHSLKPSGRKMFIYELNLLVVDLVIVLLRKSELYPPLLITVSLYIRLNEII